MNTEIPRYDICSYSESDLDYTSSDWETKDNKKGAFIYVEDLLMFLDKTDGPKIDKCEIFYALGEQYQA